MTSKTWFMVLIVLTMVSLKINAEIVTNDLVSWWKFDENGNTTVASDSVGGNDGSLSSGFGANPTWTNDTPGAASSGALFFDGINDDIDCGNGFAAISNEVIQTILHYQPTYHFTGLKKMGYDPDQCPNTNAFFYNRETNLPMHPKLTDADVDMMIEGIRNAAEKVSK